MSEQTSDVAYPILRPRKLAAPDGHALTQAEIGPQFMYRRKIEAVYRNPDGSYTAHIQLMFDDVIDEEDNKWYVDELVFARDQDELE